MMRPPNSLQFFYSQEGAAIMAENEAPPVVKYDGKVDKEKYPVYASVLEQMNLPGLGKTCSAT